MLFNLLIYEVLECAPENNLASCLIKILFLTFIPSKNHRIVENSFKINFLIKELCISETFGLKSSFCQIWGS